MSTHKTLGELILEGRTRKGYTLRKFAEAIGISSTMLSKMERDQPGFRAGVETLKRIAIELDIDSDVLLALDQKIDTDIQELIIDKPTILPRFLRTVGNQSEETLKKLMRDFENRYDQ
jgi:HTH-type transcriptional regulator, competence development regulator